VSTLASAPRGAGTDGERKAAALVETALSGLGYEVRTEEFQTLPSFSFPYILLFGLSILGSLVAFASTPAGIALSALGLVLLILEEELYYPVATNLVKHFFSSKSSNVVGKLGKGDRSLVLMAHYDSTKAAYSFNPKRVGGLRNTTLADFASAVAVVAILVLALMLPLLRFLALVAAIPLWLTIVVLIHREAVHKYVAGANDNASGVAVLLGVAQRLAASPVSDATRYVVATGSEESGMIGAYDFYARHKDLVRSAAIVNIDNPGIGEVCLVTSEGVALRHSTEPGFALIASQAAKEAGVPVRQYRLLPTDATPAMRRGWKAVSVMAFTGKGIGNYHWYNDTADSVKVENLERAVDLVGRIVRDSFV